MAHIDKRLVELGNGLFAWTQLPGSWGWSNAGLVTDGDQSLLVDTLFDRTLAAEMLAALRDASVAARRIGTVVNTHGNGDHCYGNGEVADAEIIATQGCVDDLQESPPSRNALLMRAGRVVHLLGPVGRGLGRMLSVVGVDRVALLADAAPLALSLFDAFEFAGNEVVLPNRTFSGELELKVGDKTVRLIEVGPAHTLGDAIVHVPDDRVVFTGDIVFMEAHPIIWGGVRVQLEYLQRLTDEARARHDAGMPFEDAVYDIHLDEYASWADGHRQYVNVHTLYRDFEGDRTKPDVLAMFAGMARLEAAS